MLVTSNSISIDEFINNYKTKIAYKPDKSIYFITQDGDALNVPKEYYRQSSSTLANLKWAKVDLEYGRIELYHKPSKALLNKIIVAVDIILNRLSDVNMTYKQNHINLTYNYGEAVDIVAYFLDKCYR